MGGSFETSPEHREALLQPLRVPTRAEDIYAEAKDMVADLAGWTLVSSDDAALTLVCERRSGLLGAPARVTIRVEGPAVAGLEGAFFENWVEAEGDLPEGGSTSTQGEPGSTEVQVVRSSGGSSWNDAHTAAELLLAAARRRVRIATAYFVPEERLTRALVETRQRGVTVEVMLPGEHTDHRLCNLAGRTEFETLLEAGVEIRLYQRTMLHAKIVTVDGVLSFVGSPNFNQRSMHRDDEVAMTLVDPELTRRLDQDYDRDLESCEGLDPSTWPRRGPWSRIKETCAGMLRSRL